MNCFRRTFIPVRAVNDLLPGLGNDYHLSLTFLVTAAVETSSDSTFHTLRTRALPSDRQSTQCCIHTMSTWFAEPLIEPIRSVNRSQLGGGTRSLCLVMLAPPALESTKKTSLRSSTSSFCSFLHLCTWFQRMLATKVHKNRLPSRQEGHIQYKSAHLFFLFLFILFYFHTPHRGATQAQGLLLTHHYARQSRSDVRSTFADRPQMAAKKNVSLKSSLSATSP